MLWPHKKREVKQKRCGILFWHQDKQSQTLLTSSHESQERNDLVTHYPSHWRVSWVADWSHSYPSGMNFWWRFLFIAMLKMETKTFHLSWEVPEEHALVWLVFGQAQYSPVVWYLWVCIIVVILFVCVSFGVAAILLWKGLGPRPPTLARKMTDSAVSSCSRLRDWNQSLRALNFVCPEGSFLALGVSRAGRLLLILAVVWGKAKDLANVAFNFFFEKTQSWKVFWKLFCFFEKKTFGVKFQAAGIALASKPRIPFMSPGRRWDDWMSSMPCIQPSIHGHMSCDIYMYVIVYTNMHLLSELYIYI